MEDLLTTHHEATAATDEGIIQSFDTVVEPSVSLWERLASNPQLNVASQRKLALIAHDFRAITSFTEGARSLGADIYRSVVLRQALWDVLQNKGDWAGVFLVYSDFGPIGVNFNLIRSFRQRAPNVPLVLLSDEFSSDDLTTERLPLCDISLRLPFDLSYLAEVMDVAEVNNSAWVERSKLFRTR